MRKLTWKEYVIESRKSSKELENIIVSIRKVPGESVPHNFIHIAEKDLNNKNEHSIGDFKIKRKIETVLVLDIVDKEDMEEYRENLGPIIEAKELDNGKVEVTTEGDIYSYELIGVGELFNIYTTTEAALKWGLNESTVRKAIQSGRFNLGSEYRKAGRVTLITKEAMTKVYGELK
ncbi:helix-turn-helix domain-containing protein [uncultured Clostridium sp.]|uniref:helix-turn-helix domain-containing protein n=1 Tax=uncultured Clostridium sp. TaxID=59620 RepID=UPI00280C1AC2|nr:helix-turn-helix domain-containing protein [uncultured Clostridium sp.]